MRLDRAAAFAAAVLLTIWAAVLVPDTAGAWIYFSSGDEDAELVEILEELESQGVDAETVERLEEYVDDHPWRESTDEALYRLAGIHHDRGSIGRAEKLYTRLLEKYPATRFRLEATYALADIKYARGELRSARDLAEEVSGAPLATATLRARAKLLLKDSEAALVAAGPEVEAPAIGVLLPLEGRYAQFGEAALRGVLLAAQVFGDRYGAVEVFVRNVEADPEAARQTVKTLIDETDVLGLVGPMLSATSGEVAELAQDERVPVVTLSQKEGVTSAGDYVFRNFLTSAQQAASLAEYATDVMGLTRFAVMYPDNRYGTELADLFEREVARRGGEVVRVAAYKYGTKDFSEQLTYLFDIEVEERVEGRRHIAEYTPKVEVDALFMPDTYSSVILAAPYLDYYNIKDVTLLGTNGWNSSELVRSAGEHVEGAVFVDGFFAGSSRPGAVEFSELFRATYGAEPGVIEAQAYDAARLLISAINRNPGDVPDRRELKRMLRRMEDYSGATGPITFDRGGEAEKELFVLTVRDGHIEEAPAEWGLPVIGDYTITTVPGTGQPGPVGRPRP